MAHQVARPLIGTTALIAADECASLGMMAGMVDTDVAISLTADEALILFDLLHRWEDEERVAAPRNEAEQIALWNLSALLERELREPFDPRYADRVAEATRRLTPSE